MYISSFYKDGAVLIAYSFWLQCVANVGLFNSDTDMDGMNLWPAITQNSQSPRDEFVYNIIENENEFRGAIRVGDWKLIIGRAGTPSSWYLPEDANGTFFNDYFEKTVEKDATNKNSIQLYNLKDDPMERNDLSKEHPSKVEQLRQILGKYKKSSVPPMNVDDDPAGDPSNFSGAFGPGWCDPIIDPALVNFSTASWDP